MDAGFFEAMREAIRALPAAVQLLLLMGVFAVGDVVAAIVEGPFHGTLLGKWTQTKLLPIVAVAILFTMDYATGLFSVSLGDIQVPVFATIAYTGAVAFIAQEGFSIVKHLQVRLSPPIDEPVPEE